MSIDIKLYPLNEKEKEMRLRRRHLKDALRAVGCAIKTLLWPVCCLILIIILFFLISIRFDESVNRSPMKLLRDRVYESSVENVKKRHPTIINPKNLQRLIAVEYRHIMSVEKGFPEETTPPAELLVSND